MAKFQEGDMVIAPRLWKGSFPLCSFVNDHPFPISVRIDNGTEYSFTDDGKEWPADLEPSLYHAGTKITIEEAEPKRWPWVNVYKTSSSHKFSAYVEQQSFKTKILAEIEGKKYPGLFLFSLQLKPPEE